MDEGAKVMKQLEKTRVLVANKDVLVHGLGT